jgi:hypothetical protein
MATYELKLSGDATPDDVRAAFESIVNALRDETSTPVGTLTIDGIPYEATDVADAEDFTDDVDDADDDQSDEADEPETGGEA